MRQTIGIVHILIAGGAAKLAEQPGQQAAGVLAPATVPERCSSQIGQPKSIVEFAICKQASVGGDTVAMKFQLQAPVKIDPQTAIVRFIRWMFHEPTTMANATC